ncbi:MAG: DoxX family protein [Parachlamydia sp.]|nr:DoxX family protein [Parachlamydia sp.]
MNYITLLLQLVVAFGLLNVWMIRSHRETPYRGSYSSSLKNEFAAYGLPVWSFYLIGFIKISSALLLLLGLWMPFLVLPSAVVVSLLMLGAICMHVKVGDRLKKSMPALIMLICSIGLAIGSYYR